MTEKVTINFLFSAEENAADLCMHRAGSEQGVLYHKEKSQHDILWETMGNKNWKWFKRKKPLTEPD